MINTNYKVCGSLVLYGQNFNWDMTPITEVAEQLKHIVAQKQSFEYDKDWTFGDYASRFHCLRFYLEDRAQQFSISGPDTLIDLLSYCGLWQMRELSASNCFELLGRAWVRDNVLENCMELTGYKDWQDVFHKILMPVYTNYDRFDMKEKFIAFVHVYKLSGVMLLYRNLVRMDLLRNDMVTANQHQPEQSHLLRTKLDNDCLLYGVVMRRSIV